MTAAAAAETAVHGTELAGIIDAHRETLTPSQRRIAALLLENPDSFAFARITETASRAGVTESTITRFATALGLTGYPALIALCGARLRRTALMTDRFDNTRDDTDPLRTAARDDEAAIHRTLAGIDPDQWRDAATALAGARRVAVLGLRQSHGVASMLSYLLQLIREDVTQFDLTGDRLPDLIHGIGRSDAVVAISTRPYTRQTVAALQAMHERGATAVVLTDSAASPLAPAGDVLLLADTHSHSLLSSMTAMTSLAQALANEVMRQLGDGARASLADHDQLLDAFATHQL